MPVTHKPIFPQTISNFDAVQILPADTTSLKTLVTAGANGARVENILIHSTDTAAKDVVLVMTKGGVDFPLATIQIPANSGNTNSLPPIALLKHAMLTDVLNTDEKGNRYLYLGSGSVLKIKAGATVTAARAISVIPQGGDY